MAAYVVIEITIEDAVAYAEYIERVPATVAKFGGRYLVRGGEVTPLTGGWSPERLVIIELESKRRAFEWLASPEYQAVSPLRERAAKTRAIVVEGTPTEVALSE